MSLCLPVLERTPGPPGWLAGMVTQAKCLLLRWPCNYISNRQWRIASAYDSSPSKDQTTAFLS